LPVPQQRGGRPPDPTFAPSEALYQRYSDDDLLEGRVFNPIRLRFPGQSVIRGKYCVSSDVLHPNCCGGKTLSGYSIFTIFVREIEGQAYTFREHNRERVFELFLIHRPEEMCYAHTEIWCSVQGSEKIPTNLPKEAKQAFRAALAQKLNAQIGR
jgi:hypothetical protein